ncbi:MAG: bifunctional folylpolyglutamate synthase/dihydrofolate synthase [Candidatus Omnitrophica bacterium]|nr:bifunctional folylpolyglutamate synthase/dihydrofolate synthase [Candidatus Omnitrophota bacterium]
MNYPEAISFLESLVNYEQISNYPYKEYLNLERIKEFLCIIGNPQSGLKCIHIAGTKGKGSTCAFVAYILRQAGYKTGLYTSPHLSDIRERIRIISPQCPAVSSSVQQSKEFEGMISKAAITDLVKRLKSRIEAYNKKSEYGPLTFFEVYTLLAFVYFKEEQVDFAVLETGLGGRLDATNIAQALVCGITPISYEHTQILGSSLGEIAVEKAGIIKDCRQSTVDCRQLIVVSAPQNNEARKVIRAKCKKTGSKLFEVGRDIIYKKTDGALSIKGPFRQYAGLKLRLLGEHQMVNAAVAVGIIEALRCHNISVKAGSIRRGLYNTVWPGRCEVISRKPLTILDGAQNEASSAALADTIRHNFSYRKLILVLGICRDKDIKGICIRLKALADRVILTRSRSPRASLPQSLAGYFPGKEIYLTNTIKEARSKAAGLAEPLDLILVTGSLFVAGEFRDENRPN